VSAFFQWGRFITTPLTNVVHYSDTAIIEQEMQATCNIY